MIEMIKCSTCKENKKPEAFDSNKCRGNGRANECKACRSGRAKKRDPKVRHVQYLKNKKQHQERSLKKLYGISLEKYDALRIKQNFSCAICGRHETEFNRALDVDHCHDTGKIRGLLCTSCNNGVGRFKNDIILLQKAIEYLENKE